jgi:hypothetical protein
MATPLNLDANKLCNLLIGCMINPSNISLNDYNNLNVSISNVDELKNLINNINQDIGSFYNQHRNRRFATKNLIDYLRTLMSQNNISGVLTHNIDKIYYDVK